MVVFDHDMFAFVELDVLAVDFLARVFARSHGADVEVVFQNSLYCHDRPCGVHLAFIFLALGFFALTLRHTRRGNPIVGQGISDFHIAHAALIEAEDFADDLCFGGDDFKFLPRIDDVAVRCGADPFAVMLTALDDRAHLFRGIGDGHFVDEELELYLQPVVVVRKVDAVADGDDAHAVVAQVLQLHQAAAVAARESGEVLDDQDVKLMGEKLFAHLLVALALLKGVARAVAVFEECQTAAGEFLPDIILNDCLLVLDGGVVAVQLLVNGDTAVARNVKFFYQFTSPALRDILDNIVSRLSENSKRKKTLPPRQRLLSCRFFTSSDLAFRKELSVVAEQLARQFRQILTSRAKDGDKEFLFSEPVIERSELFLS